MKKIISISFFAAIMLVSKAYAQSNLTWTLKDNVEKGYFKSHTTFNSSLSGFTSKTEATKFLTKLKSNSEVASAEVSNTDANGNGDIKLVMKSAHDKMYYVGLVQKLGVAYIVANGKKQTPTQIIEEKRAQGK